MERTIDTAIEIDAAPARVWEVLTDLEAYREWNPFIVSANGIPEVGGRLTLRMRADSKTFTVRPTVVEATEARLLRWVGRLGVRGLLDAEHSHAIEDTPTGVRYVQQESFRGVLVPFLGKTFAATQIAFEEMNVALKKRVEDTEDPHPCRIRAAAHR